MSQGYQSIRNRADALIQENQKQSLLDDKLDLHQSPSVPGGAKISPYSVEKRWNLISSSEASKEILLDAQTAEEMSVYEKNIENFIGTVKIPVGLAGPLRVRGLHAKGDFYIPLATTEAALVASYSRGARLITASGGCSAALLSEGVSRAPGFAFKNLSEAGIFLSWCLPLVETFKGIAESTSRHGKLVDMQVNVEGNRVYLLFEYTTGDASGQNMVTIATQAIFNYILENSPVSPEFSFIEANFSGDKKASSQSFHRVRGKKVSAEVLIPEKLVQRYLHTTPKEMVRYWNISALGGVMSGTVGVHGHYANGLAGLYLACGQDVACVAESAVGITRLEELEDGSLYASVTLPNLMLGTVGGGTGLPSQASCLDILGLRGPGHAQELAEVCAGVVLAGELSIHGAMCSHQFTRAHEKLARKHPSKISP